VGASSATAPQQPAAVAAPAPAPARGRDAGADTVSNVEEEVVFVKPQAAKGVARREDER
jgi:hypothetical protein